MLSARALASISDDVIELYSQLEYEIKKDMFRRINRLQKVTDATTWQAEILKETGGLKANIDKLVKKYNASSQKMLKDLFYSAMDESKNNDIKYYSLAARNLSASQKQKLNTSIDRLYNAEVINKTFAAQQAQLEKLYNDVTRMTLTVADASEKEFLKQCNNAYLKVNSGAFSWDNAYKDAINAQAREAYADAAVNLANNGVKTILYNYSGTPREYSIEAATKMNILTGINLAASQQTLENAAALGCDLVETSAHIGARDVERPGKPWSSHAAWQGRVFCLNGERDYIDGDGNTKHAANFQESCGLGEPDGICGINCRHSYYPYFEGSSLMYSKGELDEMNEKLVKLDGRNITPYEAEQELRLCERNIREYKAQTAALEMTGNTQNPKYTRARENIYKWQAKARHIVDETGIKRKYINEYIGTRDGVQPRGIAPKITVPQNTNNIKTDIKLKNIDYEKLTDNPISNARELLENNRVAKIDFMSYIEVPNETYIINKIGGGDLTKGSCSSVSNAFIANLGGYNVTDFRGGISMEIFSSRRTSIEMAKFNGVESYIEKSINDFTAVNKLLSNIKEGNYYKLGTGAHAAIVRKKEGIYQYLELQTKSKNGWYILNEKELKTRFGCKKSRTRYGMKIEVENYLIEASSLAKNKEFIEMMKYLNTEIEKQKKGIGGGKK